MSQKYMFPDYNNSILNMITSILNYYGGKNIHTSLPELDEILNKNYKNVVMVLLDGMGENVLKHASPDGLFSKHKIKTITSVFPSTTVAALTTYCTAQAPIETGWIAWSQYFKECGRSVEIFTNKDFHTGEIIPQDKFDAQKLLGYNSIFNQIEKASPDVKTFEIQPAHCSIKSHKCMHIFDIEGLCESIETLCKSDEKKYVFAYYDSPDKLNHRNCWDSDITKDFILHVQDLFNNLQKELQGTDTLMIISADHGHNNLHKHYYAMDFEDLIDCYTMPPSLEGRFTSFYIKAEKRDYFENKFKEKFKDEFLLLSKKEFLESNILGFGTPHRKIDDFIGDYVSIAISDSAINVKTDIAIDKYEKLSSHCGLTKNEMEVPLIVFDLK